MAIVNVLGDFETYLYGDEGCVLITTEAGDDALDYSSDLMRDIICANPDDEIYSEDDKDYYKKDLYVAQIGIRELLDCWNEKHGTNY